MFATSIRTKVERITQSENGRVIRNALWILENKDLVVQDYVAKKLKYHRFKKLIDTERIEFNESTQQHLDELRQEFLDAKVRSRILKK